jgi:RNA recognition motif-containing protein
MTSPAPVGEDSWVDYVDQARRAAKNLESRVHVVELYRKAVAAEPGSLKTWLAYCEYFWSLYTAFQSHGPGLSSDELAQGRDIFTLDSALHLWSEAYDAIKYRLSDSHELWNRWISLEMEQLSRTRTPEGVRRITHLYRDRLQVPHVTWDQTSQTFSTFLSDFNRGAWEQTMQEVTRNAQQAKRLLAARDPFESRLHAAAKAGRDSEYRTVFREYLEWEMLQSRRNNDKPEIGVDMCCGLFERGLSGAFFSLDESTWNEYVIFVAQQRFGPQSQSLLRVMQRAVDHCPWSGVLWSRYILFAEEAKLPLSEIAHIKHTAMSKKELFRDGMSGLIDMYVAWCGFLKRTAMNPNASDEDVDVADVGLATALEDIKLEGKAHFKNYQGDPECRLERLYIQYLTEKKRDITAARQEWNKLSGKPLHADSYDFWLRYYQWEMMIFASESLSTRGPNPPDRVSGHRDPSMATAVLGRACKRKTLDWPERIMEIYLQHCNDYEHPSIVRQAIGEVHRMKRPLQRRRLQEQEAAAYAQAQAQAQYQAQAQTEAEATQGRHADARGHSRSQAHVHAAAHMQDPQQAGNGSPGSPSNPKRKRDDEDAVDKDDDDSINKRLKTAEEDEGSGLKRDREHTSVIVTNLPTDTTQTKLKQYFKEYGHINSLSLVPEPDGQSITALVEFRTWEDARSALLRDGKFFGATQIGVRSGRNLTLYVTNYPPDADEAYIRHLFDDCGEVLSVRFPSLKYNTHRRFCYVSFKQPEAAEKATKKDGKNIAGHGKLVAKFSDPHQKKQREGAVAEGREIYITELPSGVTEADVRELCAKFGTVSRINIPLNLAGKSRGFAYVSFDRKESAEAAVAELSKSKFRGHILEAQLAKDRNFKQYAKLTLGTSVSPSRAPSEYGEGMVDVDDSVERRDRPTPADIRARTVALTGLPDTVNDARVRALVEGTSAGRIVQLTVQPGKGTAKVEFEDVAAAGRAVLQLEGVQIDGHHIRAGGVDELRRGSLPQDRTGPTQSIDSRTRALAAAAVTASSSASAKSAVFVPSTVRKPMLGRGPHKGIGLAPGAKGNEAKGEERRGDQQQGGDMAGRGGLVHKTNADFKAMFISSGSTNGAASS